MKTLYLFPALATAASAIPAVYGVGRSRRWLPGARALWRWFLVSAIANLAGMFLSLSGIRTGRLEEYQLLLMAFFGMEALGRLSESRSVLGAFRLSAVAYLVVWLWCVSSLERQGDFNTYVTPLLGVAFTLAAATLIVTRIRADVTSLLRDTAVLAGLATLLLWAPIAVLNPVSSVLYHDHRPLVEALFKVASLLDVSASLLVTKALQWTPVAVS